VVHWLLSRDSCYWTTLINFHKDAPPPPAKQCHVSVCPRFSGRWISCVPNMLNMLVPNFIIRFYWSSTFKERHRNCFFVGKHSVTILEVSELFAFKSHGKQPLYELSCNRIFPNCWCGKQTLGYCLSYCSSGDVDRLLFCYLLQYYGKKVKKTVWQTQYLINKKLQSSWFDVYLYGTRDMCCILLQYFYSFIV